MNIEDCEFSTRTENCLLSNGYKTVADIEAVSELVLLRIPNLGRRSLWEINAKLAYLKEQRFRITRAEIIDWALAHEDLIRALMRGQVGIAAVPKEPYGTPASSPPAPGP